MPLEDAAKANIAQVGGIVVLGVKELPSAIVLVMRDKEYRAAVHYLNRGVGASVDRVSEGPLPMSKVVMIAHE